jgi:tRNA pseudouridine38-40 synthase
MPDDLQIAARRFKLTVAYDGTSYAGWQVQPRDISVQQVIEEALQTVCGQKVKVHGSGRTDRGVHARGQVAHVDLATRIAADALGRALNARLPRDIRVLRVAEVRHDFHARRSALRKEYRYFVWNALTMPPDKRLYAAHVHRPLDVAAMRAAAAYFVGRHDFASFTANPQREVASTVREVYGCTIAKKGPEIVFRVSGEGFLYKQVRSMVGFLLRVGQGAERPEAVAELLAVAAPRKARVPSAVPQGLFLWRVFYPRYRTSICCHARLRERHSMLHPLPT